MPPEGERDQPQRDAGQTDHPRAGQGQQEPAAGYDRKARAADGPDPDEHEPE